MNNSLSSPAHKSSRVRSNFNNEDEIVDDSAETMEDLFAFDDNEGRKNARQRSIEQADLTGSDMDDEDGINEEISDEGEDEEASGEEEEITKKLSVSDKENEESIQLVQRSAIVHVGRNQILSSDEEDETNSGQQHSILEDSSNVSKSEKEIEIVDESEEKVDDSLVIVEESIVQSSTAASSTKSLHMSKATEDKSQNSYREVKEVFSDTSETSKPPKKNPDSGNQFVLAQQQPLRKHICRNRDQLKMILAEKHGRLFGGQMTEERMEKIQFVTNDMINAMHK